MEVLTPRGELEVFFGELGRASAPLLFTDYDGTLAPFRTDPSKATPYEGVHAALQNILRCGSRLVVVSGRAIDDLLPLLQLSAVEVWGSHGRERLMASGRRWSAPVSSAAQAAMARVDRLLVDAGLGGRREKKAGCIAVHRRGLDDAAAERVERTVEEIWAGMGPESGLALKRFDGGMEFLIPGISKGDVIRHVLEEVGTDGPVAAYLGDDFTDEDAFQELSGRGLCVLVRPEYRETLADVWLVPPVELLSFLDRWSRVVKESRS